MICRCCHLRKAAKYKRGLCWSCYIEPGVRDLYPSTSPKAPKTKPTDIVRCRVPPAEVPTAAKPGSPEKVAVLAERFAAETDLWHEADAGWG
jgi:hypothetical protein